MKSLLALAVLLLAAHATAEMSLGNPSSATTNTVTSPTTASTSSIPMTQTTTSIPQAGTSAGSPQMAGPMNSAPNGAGGTYGYPNNPIDPNTANPGIPSQPYYGGPYYNNGNGTVSGTTTSVNPAGAPFVTPPSTTSVSPSVPASR